MVSFFRNHWQDLGWLTGYLAGSALLVWAIGPIGFIAAFAVGVLFYASTGLSPRAAKITGLGVFVPIITLASFTVYEWSKTAVTLKFPEPRDTAVVPKAKTDVEKLTGKIDAALENMAALSDSFDTMKKGVDEKIDEKSSYFEGRLDALTQRMNEDREQRLSTPRTTEPTFQWVPVLPKRNVPPEPAEEEEYVKPKGSVIPNTTPREDLPELRAKIPEPQKKQVFPKKLVCNCGQVHEIKDWLPAKKAGSYWPVYDRCVNPHTGLACDVRDYEKVVQK